jgi:hypothetical protein
MLSLFSVFHRSKIDFSPPKDTNPQIAKIHLLKAKKATIRWDRGISFEKNYLKNFYKYFLRNF